MANNSTGPTTIMIVRHAEKPGKYYGDKYYGVDLLGDTSGSAAAEHLITTGWERAGGIVTLFAPPWGPKPGLAAPDFLYAADPESKKASTPVKAAGKKSQGEGPSQRPYETLLPLAAVLGTPENPKKIHKQFKKNDYPAMITDALTRSGTVLICWQHEDIPLENGAGQPGLSQCILTQTGTTGTLGIPSSWPVNSKGEARYDLVFVFNRPSGAGPIQSFEIIAQNLLAGDEPAPPPALGAST